jgi:NAD(P)H-hydrate repair Nnr-like enzyme with NAD(P)H-hydrate dehydratase domain
MWRATADDPDEALQRATVVAGCGGGPRIGAALPRLLARAPRLVLDADALNAVAADPQLLAGLLARGDRGQPTVLTPHPLEAARLLGSEAASVQRDRLGAARALADRTAAVVVLKGSGTVVATPGSAPPRIVATGGPALATAGTGDVLAGWLGGRWSVAAGPTSAEADSRSLASEVALAAAVEHGAAGVDSGGTLTAGRLVLRLAGPGGGPGPPATPAAQ